MVVLSGGVLRQWLQPIRIELADRSSGRCVPETVVNLKLLIDQRSRSLLTSVDTVRARAASRDTFLRSRGLTIPSGRKCRSSSAEVFRLWYLQR